MKNLLVGALLCLSALTATNAEAQTSRVCGLHAKVIERLHTGYGETRQMIGLGSNGAILEVFASEESGSWTILVTNPQGVSCLIAAGQAFENVRGQIILEGDPT